MTDDVREAFAQPLMRVWTEITFHPNRAQAMFACDTPAARRGFWTAVAVFCEVALTDEDHARLEVMFGNYARLMAKLCGVEMEAQP